LNLCHIHVNIKLYITYIHKWFLSNILLNILDISKHNSKWLSFKQVSKTSLVLLTHYRLISQWYVSLCWIPILVKWINFHTMVNPRIPTNLKWIIYHKMKSTGIKYTFCHIPLISYKHAPDSELNAVPMSPIFSRKKHYEKSKRHFSLLSIENLSW